MFTTANTRFTFTFFAVAFLYTLAVLNVCVSASPLPSAPEGLAAPLALAQGVQGSQGGSSPLALLTGSESITDSASSGNGSPEPEPKASSPLNLLGNLGGLDSLDSLPISQLAEHGPSSQGSASANANANSSAHGANGGNMDANAPSPLSLLGRRAYYARPAAPADVAGLVGPRGPLGLGPRSVPGAGAGEEMMKREERFRLRMMRRAAVAAA